jgi:hypothetical protein
MENRNNVLLILLVSIVVLLSVGLTKNFNEREAPVASLSTTCKEDSLIKVITDLEIELKNEQDGWDNKERRYENILFEYEYGLDHLKNYHLKAYKDFHRILSHREYYSHEIERENIKRLQIEKW